MLAVAARIHGDDAAPFVVRAKVAAREDLQQRLGGVSEWDLKRVAKEFSEAGYLLEDASSAIRG